MDKILTAVKAILVILTAVFVAFHTVIFIKSIEPNPYLAWMLAGVIEGFLITLAMKRAIAAKVLLIPLFLISVLSSTSSFVIKNEAALNQFLNLKATIQANLEAKEAHAALVKNLEKDLNETQGQLQNLDKKYMTKTLERERKLKDNILSTLSRTAAQTQIDYLVLIKAGIFLFIIFIVQLVSLYTAASLKNGDGLLSKLQEGAEGKLKNFSSPTSETLDEPAPETVEAETTETVEAETTETVEAETTETVGAETIASGLKRLQERGISLSKLAIQSGVSKSTLSRAIRYRVSDDVNRKIFTFLKTKP